MDTTGVGFILTRAQVETVHGNCLEFWLATPQGPVRLLSEPQSVTFFIEQSAQEAIPALLKGLDYRLKPLPLKTFAQTPVAALYFSKPGQAYMARDRLKDAGIVRYEEDIRIADRFLMERFVYGSLAFRGQHQGHPTWQQINQARIRPADYVPSLRALSLDIECSASGQLFSIGLATDSYQKVLMVGAAQGQQDWIDWVADERALLLALVEEVQHLDPDLILGWNLVNFDFRLLQKRATLLNVALNLGRARSPISWRDGADGSLGFVSIPGRVAIDGIDALKTATYQFDSFSLEYVAQRLLGKGKAMHAEADRLAEIAHDFKHNKLKLAHYNPQDCLLVLEIFAHTKLLDFLVLRSRLTGLQLDRSGGSVAAFTNLYLPKLHRAGYIAPNLPADGGLASPGGYVMDSKPGLYRNVLVLDFKSLYPSIILTFKIDPLGLVEGLRAPHSAIPGFRGAHFSRDKHFLPDIIASLWKQRDAAKRNQDSARSQAIKILMNSFYGVLGSGGCRFYDTRLASSITLRGHHIMQTTAVWIEEQGYQVIYGDTDSTFVWLGDDKSDEQAQEIGRQLATMINTAWQRQLAREFRLESYLEIEFETHFKRFLMPTIRGSELGSKKRYAGLKSTPDGDQLVFKGLESVRSDWTALAREFQQRLYEKVFAGEEVGDYIREVLASTRRGEQDQKLVYRKRLRRPLSQYVKNIPPHVRAARLADEHNQALGKPLRYQQKGWIQYLMTIQGPEPVEYRRSPLDYEHYIDKQLRPVAEGILPMVGMAFEDFANDQMGLF